MAFLSDLWTGVVALPWGQIVTAGATLALAVIAGLQIHHLRQERADRRAELREQRERLEREAEERISYEALGLRRQLLSWVGRSGSPHDPFSRWLWRNQRTASTHFDQAEERLRRMSDLSVDAPPDVASVVRQVTVLFLTAIDCATRAGSITERLSWHADTARQARNAAAEECWLLIRILEGELIDKDASSDESELLKRRPELSAEERLALALEEADEPPGAQPESLTDGTDPGTPALS